MQKVPAYRRLGAAAVALGATLMLVLTACGGGEDDPAKDGLRKLRWGTATPAPTMAQAYYSSIPKALGYWEDEGIDMELNNFKGGFEIIQAIDAGKLDIGGTGTPDLWKAASSGLPVKGVYATVTGSFFTPSVMPSSDIKSIKDILGKNIGVAAIQHASAETAKALYQMAGGDPNKAQLVAVGSGPTAYEALRTGRVDVLVLWDGPYAAILNNPANQLRFLDAPDLEKVGFQAAVITSQKFIDDDRDLVVKVGRGIAKASLFTATNPECGVKVHWSVYPDSRPAGVSEEEALKMSVNEFNARKPFMTPKEQDGLWGSNTPAEIQSALDLAKLAGGVGDVNIDKAVDLSMVEEMNDFDHEAVIKAAQACDV